MSKWSTLADAIADLEARLRDAGNADWSDAQLAEHLATALERYSAVAPYTRIATLTASVGLRRYSLAALSDRFPGRRGVAAVEWPTGRYPRAWCRFEVESDAGTDYLVLLTPDAPASGDAISVHTRGPHILDETDSTIPETDQPHIVNGAAGYAAEALARSLMGKVTVDRAYDALASWGRLRAREFEVWLREVSSREIIADHLIVEPGL